MILYFCKEICQQKSLVWRAAVDDSKHAGEHQGPAWIRDWLHHGDDHCWDNDVCGDFYNDDDDNDTLKEILMITRMLEWF